LTLDFRISPSSEFKKATQESNGLIKKAPQAPFSTQKLPLLRAKLDFRNIGTLEYGAVCALLLIRANWCATRQKLTQNILFYELRPEIAAEQGTGKS
jgi:hypothetical protein